MRRKLRAVFLGLLGALSLAASLPAMAATPAGLVGFLPAPISGSVLPVSHKCGKGQYWVPAGYAKHGKYRAGHCAPK
jgi:hypothetical protein